MGEAKRRGTFEDRKRQAIDAKNVSEAARKVRQEDELAARSVSGTSGARSKRSLSLAIAAMMAMASASKL